MRRMVEPPINMDVFTSNQANDRKIYAFVDKEWRVCVANTKDYGYNRYRFIVLSTITCGSSYCSSANFSLRKVLEETQKWEEQPTIYEFDDVVEFLNWALQMEMEGKMRRGDV